MSGQTRATNLVQILRCTQLIALKAVNYQSRQGRESRKIRWTKLAQPTCRISCERRSMRQHIEDLLMAHAPARGCVRPACASQVQSVTSQRHRSHASDPGGGLRSRITNSNCLCVVLEKICRMNIGFLTSDCLCETIEKT